MMLRNLYDHAVETQTLKSKKAKYIELHENGNEVTLLYKIEGQRYPNDKPSARTMPKHVAKTEIRVDEEGYIVGGTVIKKQNFWTWDYKSEESENEA